MKKRIYIDGRALVPRNQSGIGHYVSGILRALDDIVSDPLTGNIPEIRVLVPYRARKMVEDDMNFSTISFTSIPLPFRVINNLSRLGLLPPLDLFYGKGVYVFPVFTPEKVTRSKRVVFFYDFVFKHFPESMNAKQRELIDARYKDALASDGVITISQAVSREIKAENPKAKTLTAYPSVDTSRFYKRSVEEVVRFKNEARISGAYILSVGNFEPRKDMLSLIKAYRELPDEIVDRYTLVLAGANSWLDTETSEYVKQSLALGYKIKTLVGKVKDKDMPALYSGASLFVFPSKYEGYGMPVIEAMACGVPVITSSSPSVVEAGGGAALVVKDTQDTKAFAESIQNVLKSSSRSNELRKAGFERVDSAQEWKAAGTTLHNLLKKLSEER